MRSASLEAAPRRRVVALVGEHDAEIVEGLRDPHVLAARTPAGRSRAPVRAAAAPCRRRRGGDRSGPSCVSISACSSGWPTSSFCTCSAPASSSAAHGRLARGRRGSHTDRRCVSSPISSSLTLAAFVRLALRAIPLGREPARVAGAIRPAISTTTAAVRRDAARRGAARTSRAIAERVAAARRSARAADSAAGRRRAR